MTGDALAILSIRCAALAGMLRCLFGFAALTTPGAWHAGLVDDTWLMLWFGSLAGVLWWRYPAWSAVSALVGSAFASAPFAAAGWLYESLPTHYLLPALLWVLVIQIPLPSGPGPWRFAALGVVTLSLMLAVHDAYSLDQPWVWLAPLSLSAVAVLVVRCVRSGYSMRSYAVLSSVGLLPILALLSWWALTGAAWIESPAVVLAVNLWLSLASAAMVGIWHNDRMRNDHRRCET